LQQEQEQRAGPASSVSVASGEQQEEATASHHVGGVDEAKASGHVGEADKGGQGEGDGEEKRSSDEQQEVDWKSDEEFKKFMGNPSIEAAIKLEKKRADRKLRELDREPDANPVAGLFRGLAKDQLAREKQRLELAEQTFKALDLNKVISFLNLLCLILIIRNQMGERFELGLFLFYCRGACS
jgi:hypothetical protein